MVEKVVQIDKMKFVSTAILQFHQLNIHSKSINFMGEKFTVILYFTGDIKKNKNEVGFWKILTATNITAKSSAAIPYLKYQVRNKLGNNFENSAIFFASHKSGRRILFHQNNVISKVYFPICKRQNKQVCIYWLLQQCFQLLHTQPQLEVLYS